ncbi:flagellar basal body rod protein FlgC [Photobacterium galatheae]|uniref:Flagellar basal-body rod protein FlgC n=2 Tax=Photobacterium galatheae TaxID=1654360 RepID=A0A066RKI8_9GAMM|nr:flagellar basal body rod protein FlgC [Photobacterium galatheae]KDM90854.1 hypothetical protein EA58_13925 [Photobacterium galatheae]
MSIIDGMNAATTAMTAQAHRMNTVAGNIANLNTVASSPEQAHKARLVTFKTIYQGEAQTVVVRNIVESTAPNRPIFDPNNPLADAQGYIYASNVNREEQMADLISAQQSYEANAQVAKTLKNLAISTIKSIKSNQ